MTEGTHPLLASCAGSSEVLISRLELETPLDIVFLCRRRAEITKIWIQMDTNIHVGQDIHTSHGKTY